MALGNASDALRCGTGYEGFLCSGCDTSSPDRLGRYYMDGGFERCEPCSSVEDYGAWLSFLAVLGVVAMIAIVYAYRRWRRRRLRTRTLGIWGTNTRLHRMARIIAGRGTPVNSELSMELTDISSDGAGQVPQGVASFLTSPAEADTPRTDRVTSLFSLWTITWRCARIYVALYQVLGPLVSQLDFNLPLSLQTMMHWFSFLKVPLLDSVQLECQGVPRSFYRAWVLNVFVQPGILLALVLVVWAWRRRNTHRATEDAKSHALLALFLQYPRICTDVCSLFDCTRVTQCVSVLAQDHAVICYDRTHTIFQWMAAVVGIFVCFGVPIFLFARLADWHGDSRKQPHIKRCIKIISDELGIPEKTAASAWRDLMEENQFTFLTDSYRAERAW